MRFPRSSCLLFLTGMTLAGPGSVNAQSLSRRTSSHPGLADDSVRQQNKVIRIDAKDRSIESILKEIVQKSEIRLFFSPDNPDLQKKITVALNNVTPLEAVNTVIRGTNLVAGKTTDGQGIMIRSKSDTTQKSPGTAGKTSIVGVVWDSAGKKPIAGATVVLSTRINTPEITNEKGVFRFDNIARGKHQVSVRMLGYVAKSLTLTIDDEPVVTPRFNLVSSATSLSEVVTTATGQQRRVEIAHDIAKINPEAIMERTPVRSVADILEAAQIPGVLIQRQSGDPGAATKIRIRGIGSISQSNDPVVILDGAWIDATTSRPSRLDDIDPSSIASIEIIRGPSAATLFGQDASNGVIVITTKKGQVGPTRWNLSYNRDWGQTYGRQPLLYVGVGTQPGISDPQWCPIEKVLRYECIQDSVKVFDLNNPLLSREGVETNNRYVAQLDGGASNITYSLTASTGNTIGVRRRAGIDNLRYRILGYTPTGEFNTPSELRRNNLTMNVAITPRPNVNLSMTVTGSQSTLKDNAVRNTWAIPNYGNAGNEVSLDTVFWSPYGISTMTAAEQPVRTTTGILSTTVQYRPRGSYVVNGNFGVEKTSRNESWGDRVTACSVMRRCWDTLGRASEVVEDRSVYTVRLNASTGLNLGRLNRFLELRPSIGGDYRKTDQHMVSVFVRDVPVGSRALSAGIPVSSSAALVENATAGWYLNSTIGLFRRIYFDMGVRQDIGSAISSSKDAVYPKIGGSWLVSDESFWRENRFINNFRLRSAIGHAAVQPDLGDIHGRFVNGVEYIDGQFVRTADLIGIGNNRLQPERAVELEVGFDLDMLGDRLNLIGTYAHTENKNTLVIRGLPPSLGAYTSNRKENVARVRNRNFELSANARALETQRMLLILNYALTLSDNIVTRLGNGIGPFPTGTTRVQAGYPLAAAWSPVVLGYRDANSDGLLSKEEIIYSDSTVYLGWTQPRYRASYGVSFTVNNQFVLDSRFAYQSRYVQSYALQGRYGAEDINAPLSEQANSIVYDLNGRRPISDMRWSSASITYHLPKSILSRIGGRAVSVSLQGSNLGLWTNYAGRDPGVNSNILNGDTSYDNGLLPPRPRLFVFDFNVGF